jgi:hypothetical protein
MKRYVTTSFSKNQTSPKTMSSITIAIILLVANGLVLLSNSLPIVATVWLTALVGLFFQKVIKLHAIFLLVTVLPMAIALSFVWIGATEKPIEVETYFYGNTLLYISFLVLRIASIGAIFQWLFIPLIREKKLDAFLSDIHLGQKVITAVVSTLVLMEDVKRKGSQAIDARIARGLVGNNRIDRWKSVLSTISPVVYTSIIAGINRADLWSHRGINVYQNSNKNSIKQKMKFIDWFCVTWFLLLASSNIWIHING